MGKIGAVTEPSPANVSGWLEIGGFYITFVFIIKENVFQPYYGKIGIQENLHI